MSISFSTIGVLVVEDDALGRLVALGLIEKEGFQIFAAADADAAVKLIEGNSVIGVVFTDINMPGPMDGLRLARQVARRWPHIEIIVTSGLLEVDVAGIPERAVFLPKPYLRPQLTQLLREMGERVSALV